MSEIEPVKEKNTLSLSADNNQIDLSMLSEIDRQEVAKEMALKQVALHAKGTEMGLESRELDENLKNIEATVADATMNGAHAQVTKVQDNTLGRTEVIIGNTDNAARGKLSKSQTGGKDNTVLYVVLVLLTIVIVALILK